MDRVVKVILRGDVSGLVSSMKQGARAVTDTADKMTGASAEADSFRDSLDQLGGTAGRVGLAAAAGVGAIVYASANFQQAMSRIDAATHETAKNMELLRAATLKAGADTVFSATEAADAVTALAKAGISTQDILNGALTGSLALASAGELGVEQAAEIAATVKNQFALLGSDVPHIADVLAAAAGKAQGEVTDMADALNYVGPVAHQMNISLEESAGAIAELAYQGIVGEKAGTGLRGILSSLSSPSSSATREMDKLGISMYNAQGNFIGFTGIADQLQTHMGRLTNAERDQSLGRIFGNEQITAARILYAGGAKDVAKWTAAVNATGYAEDTAARKLDNWKGDIEQLKGSIETLLITSGDGAQGPLRSLTQEATSAVNALNSLPGPIKNTAVGLLAITAVTGGAIWFGAKVVAGITATRAALTGLAATAGATRTALLGMAKGIGFFVAIAGISAMNNAMTISQQKVEDWKDSLLMRTGPDPVAQLQAVNDEIKKQQQIIDDAFGPTFQVPFIGPVTPLAFGNDWKDAEVKLKSLKQTQEDLKHQQDLGAIAAEQAGGAIATLGVKSALTADQVKAMAEALKQADQDALKTAESFVGMGKDVDNTKVSLHAWIKQLHDQAKALRDFTHNAKEAGRKGLEEGLIQDLEKLGPTGAMRLKQLADATKREIREANRAWRAGQAAADAYRAAAHAAAEPTIVRVDTGPAVANLTGLDALILRITRPRVIPITAKGQGLGVLLPEFGGGGRKNRDGTVDHDGNPKTGNGKAAGGTVGGSRYPYGDKVWMPVAPGEEIISNRHGQADRNRALLKLINAGGMAGGGTVGGGGLGAYIRNDLDLKFPTTLKAWNDALKASKRSIDAEKKERDDLVSARDAEKSAITSALKGDLFGSDRSSNWQYMSAGARNKSLTEDPIAQLRKEISTGTEYKTLLQTLTSKGLNGSAYDALASSGDIERLRAFAAESKSELATYENLFKQRDTVVAGAANYAGTVTYSKQIAESNRHLATGNHYLAAIEHKVEALTKAMKHAAHDHAQTVTSKNKASRRSSAASVRTRTGTP